MEKVDAISVTLKDGEKRPDRLPSVGVYEGCPDSDPVRIVIAERRDNRLERMACPQCGQNNEFKVVASCRAYVNDTGVPRGVDFSWKPDAGATCVRCGLTGKVIDFRPWEPEAKEEETKEEDGS